MQVLKHLLLLSFSLIVSFPLFGQSKSTKWDAEVFKALEWRNIGPFRGGRSNAISGVIGNDQLYYAGYTGGGVWKTEDAGLNWTNISDGFFKSGSVGEIAVAEADPNIIYVGMGEHAVRGVMTTFGDGIYKSADAGKTWTHLGLEKTRHISDIAIHPDNPDIVFVAAQGAVHGPNKERGIYKSIDGGKNWKQVLFVDENTGASSLSMDMNNPRILYAATWQHRRYPWQVESGGPGCSIWKSTDEGESWEEISAGLPSKMGKIGVSVSRVKPDRVFAIIESEKSKAGVYRSDDGGKNWKHLTNDQNLTARSWYYMEIFADPTNAEVVYVLNAPVMRSTDGGKTFARVNVGHGDTHDLWINPNNGNNMILGDDGGAEITFNWGTTWSSLNNQPTAQFYRVNADRQFPYHVYGGQQDNSSVVIASRTNSAGISDKDWFSGPGCESAYIAFNPDNPVMLYGGCYQGLIEALDTRTMEGMDIMQYPSLNLANPPKDMKYRYNWNAPIVASPHDPNTIYHAGNVLFKTVNGGISWEAISPDLTRNDTTKQDLGGVPLTNEGAGGENYNTIYYIMESPIERGVIYTGSDCGLVHITKDGGKNWENITPPNLPECTIQSIEVSSHARGTAYVCANLYKFNDFSSMNFKTTDYGKTWIEINHGINKDDFLRVIREDKKEAALLYGGGERGFYISFNGGKAWHQCQLNLPVVPITDLIIQDNDLIAATQGRAFWILDDLSPFQQSMGKFDGGIVQLFTPKTTVRFSAGGRGRPANQGTNPMNGVILDYYLPEDADSNLLNLEILNASGKVIRSYSNQKDKSYKKYPGGPSAPKMLPDKGGLNRFAWNLRTRNVKDVPNAFVYGNYNGHTVAPGQYSARLSYNGETQEAPILIVPDPRTKATKAEFQEQQALLEKITGHIEDIHSAILQMRKVKKQIGMYNEMLKGDDANENLIGKGKMLKEKIDLWENQLIQTKQKNTQDVINFPSMLNTELFTLRRKLDVHDPKVTNGVKIRLQDLEKQWNAHRQTMNTLIATDIAAYNQAFKAKGIPALLIGE